MKIKTSEIKQQVKTAEANIKNTQALLHESVSVQVDYSLDATVRDYGGERVESDLEGLRRFIIIENKTLMNKMKTQGIVSFKRVLKTSACVSIKDRGIRYQ